MSHFGPRVWSSGVDHIIEKLNFQFNLSMIRGRAIPLQGTQ
jgi:hypothetical protein